MVVNIVVAVIVAYLLGSIPTAYLIARGKRGVDIREVGDRYSGAKNVFREVGPAAGAATAAVDIAKGGLAIMLARALQVPDVVILLVGFAVVGGHIWPVFLQFRGGAGFATVIGITFAALPRESFLLLVPYLILLATVGRRFGLGLSSAPMIVPLLLLAWWLNESPALIATPLTVGCFVGVRVYRRELLAAVRRAFSRDKG